MAVKKYSTGTRKSKLNKDGSTTLTEKTSSGWKKVSRSFNVGAGSKKSK
jgi:hypothetical protein